MLSIGKNGILNRLGIFGPKKNPACCCIKEIIPIKKIRKT